MNKKQLIKLCSIVTSVLALVMVFMNLLSLDTKVLGISIKDDIKGTDIIFGNDYLDFSFIGLILLILLVAMVALSVYKYTQKKPSEIIKLSLVVVSIVAAILFFMVKTSIILNTTDLTFKVIESAFSLSIFAILGGVFSIITALLATADIVIKK